MLVALRPHARRTASVRSAALALVIVVAPVSAGAGVLDEDLERPDRSHSGVTLGLFTPIGELGVEYTQAVREHLEVSAGAGLGLFVRVGPQVAVVPRVRARYGALTLLAGIGLSCGRYNNISAFARVDAPRIFTVWANPEVGVQAAGPWRTFARFSLGVGVQVAHGAYDPTDTGVRDELNAHIPYGGLTVGALL
jgi:hypothetical protein